MRASVVACLWFATLFASVQAVPARGVRRHTHSRMDRQADVEPVTMLRSYAEPPLNIHLVCHTHDDVGWLKTVDEYYYGANTTIQHAGVQYILDSVVLALLDNPERKFIYVEMAFFTRWWNEQQPKTKDQVKYLVQRGQLEFINGGWCMNDEANPHYVDIIDQMTEGHRFLMQEFGVAPVTGWHIDPFGHSSWQAVLFSKMGFSSFHIGRLDYWDVVLRTEQKRLQFLWQPSPSLSKEGAIFGEILFQNGERVYGPPTGLCFDQSCHDDPMEDDPRLEGNNMVYKANLLYQFAVNASQYMQTPNVQLTMGSDFEYENANTWFKNLDKLIAFMRANPERYPNVNVFYSTPTIYSESVMNSTFTNWEVKTDDFFPYANDPHNYFTGYITSRPALKGNIRENMNYLQTCRQFELLSALQLAAAQGGLRGNVTRVDPRLVPFVTREERQGLTALEVLTSFALDTDEATYAIGTASDRLAQAMGLAQHHDAVSGTEKQHVADDYALQLDMGHVECESLMNAAMMPLSFPQSDSKRDIRMQLESISPFVQCDSLNISVCNITQSNQDFAMLLWNPLPRARDEWVRLPIGMADITGGIDVLDGRSNVVVPSQIVANRNYPYQASPPLPVSPQPAAYSVVFRAEALPPMGYATFYVLHRNSSSTHGHHHPFHRAGSHKFPSRLSHRQTDTQLEVINSYISVSFDLSTGLMVSISNVTSGHVIPITQSLGYYNASAGNSVLSGQASGAYIFRPNRSEPFPCGPMNGNATLTILSSGPVAYEIYQVFGNFCTQVFRLYDVPYFELEYTIGPIPIDDSDGKEVITRFETGLQSEVYYYTDSNAREMQPRQLNYRPTWKLDVTEPVAGNYYSLNAAAYIRDETAPTDPYRLTVLSDRSQGCASLAPGQFEVMMHRRLLYDDHRGVGEPLNETAFGEGLVINTKHRILLAQDGDVSSYWQRTFAAEMAFDAVPLFATLPMPGMDGIVAWEQDHAMVYTALLAALPPNLLLITFQVLSNDAILIRLAHDFAVDEHSVYSSPVRVNLQDMFATFGVIGVQELTLSANQAINNIPRLRPRPATPFIVTINPMDIRTFQLTVA